MGIKDTCTGDHTSLVERQLLSHYNSGCRDGLTRKAKADESKRYYQANKATTPTKPKSSAGKPGRRTAGSKSVTDASSKTPQPTTPKPAPPVIEDTVTSLGACRRLRTLVRIGHTPAALAAALGFQEGTIWWLLLWPQEQIKTATHAAIIDVYQRRRYEPQQGANTTADRAVALARAQDWPTPFSFENIDSDPTPEKKNTHDVDSLLAKLSRVQSTLDNERHKVAELERELTLTKPATDEADELHRQLADANTEIARLRISLDGITTHAAEAGQGRHRAAPELFDDLNLNKLNPNRHVALEVSR